MIRENQVLLNKLNILSDAALVCLSFLAGYYLRFHVLPGGKLSVPFRSYLAAGIALAAVQTGVCAVMGLYESQRRRRFYQEAGSLLLAEVIGLALLMTWLFLVKSVHFARLSLALFFLTETLLLWGKRLAMRKLLRTARSRGFNQKTLVIVGSGQSARMCLKELRDTPELGYRVAGYVSDSSAWTGLDRLGDFAALGSLLEALVPDEVIAGLGPEEYAHIPGIIAACEDNGIKLSLVPAYVQYMPARPQFDSLNGIPLLNLRRVPLDNLGSAFLKRCTDLAGALVLLALTSPVMLAAAVGVRLSSPGPILFRQERVGRHQKTFTMYKFRSMRVNDTSDTAWSRDRDPRKTRFGAFIRKYSIDELPQLFNVLRGDMSLVGPRPELPHFVEKFKKEIPLYMVKHQVKPGITGWAQVHGLRGDTSIQERIRYDIFYIENWSLWLDLKILVMSLGCLRNQEKL